MDLSKRNLFEVGAVCFFRISGRSDLTFQNAARAVEVFLILKNRHKLPQYDGMSMTSSNISLPEALKEYVQGQVASGDWGTPSEYVRELIRQDKERRSVAFCRAGVPMLRGTPA